MKAQNPSKSLGEGRDVTPSLAHPSQKQNLVVYTEELTHLVTPDLSSRQVGISALQLYIFIPVAQLAVHAGIATLILLVLLHSTLGLVLIPRFVHRRVLHFGSSCRSQCVHAEMRPLVATQSDSLRIFFRARFRAKACFTRRFAPGFR